MRDAEPVQEKVEAVHTATADARRSVADLVETLSPEELGTPSLCAGWDVATVAAHLAEAATPGSLRTFVLDVVRAGGRVHRANDLAARRAARRPAAESVALLRAGAGSRFVPPLTGVRAPLTDVLVHQLDIAVPLGRPVVQDPAAVGTALEFVTTGRPVGFVARGRLRGVRLVATDLDRSWGSGAEVRGPGSHLLAAACGRTALLPRLTGPGRELLAAR